MVVVSTVPTFAALPLIPYIVLPDLCRPAPAAGIRIK